MDDSIFEICRVVATLAGLVVAYYVIPALKAVVARHIDEDILDFVKSAVYAAQQTLTDNGIKKKYVLKVVSEWLTDKGIKMTDEQIDILIESAVLAMKTQTRK